MARMRSANSRCITTNVVGPVTKHGQRLVGVPAPRSCQSILAGLLELKRQRDATDCPSFADAEELFLHACGGVLIAFIVQCQSRTVFQ